MLVCEGLCVCVGQNATKWLCVRVCVPLAGTAVMSLGCSASASRTWERCLLMEPCRCNQSPAMCYWLILAIPNQHPYVFVLVVYTYLGHSMLISVRSRILSGFFRFGIFPRHIISHDWWSSIHLTLQWNFKQTPWARFSQHPWKCFYQPVLLSVSTSEHRGCGVRMSPVTLAHIKRSTTNSSTSAGPSVRLPDRAKGRSHLELWQPTGP